MKQRQLVLVGDALKPSMLPESLIARCTDAQDALVMCWNNRVIRYSLSHAAELLGMDKGYMSRCINGKGNFPPDLIPELQELCGNLAFTQYMNFRFNLDAVAHQQTPAERIAELEKQVHQLGGALHG